MIVNSTLFYFMDGSEGENELINIDEMLDPFGKCSLELENSFKSINFSPRKEIVEKILMNA